ncbi:dihydroxyacetone kinase subunit DhaL [Salinarimonas chemoclinalis]|uniref:dihydroxyacetone kinase subunit DhaL n=1 Tax=Salinarimonas chemoclinalis TaxID=3241599 RepID=UPI0035568C52
MATLRNAGSGAIVSEIAAVIVENRAYLSEIDGRIGDGDHGVNMAKGFSRAAERLAGRETSLAEALDALGQVLMSEIGGSMGPLYGMMFIETAEAIEDAETIDVAKFASMLRAGLAGVESVGAAKVGDKTMLDALVPAVETAEAAAAEGKDFPEALAATKQAAIDGRERTRDLVAKIGRASRLGERSKGVLDAGATSCSLIVGALADGIAARLDR